MDKFLKPDRFDADPSEPGAAKLWLYWLRTFNNFLTAIPAADGASINKLNLLVNYVAPGVYEHIAECNTYNEAIQLLESIYIQPKNEVYARHVLATRRQAQNENLEQYMQSLKILAKDCGFRAVTADAHRDEYIRDAFINGLSSAHIRQRLLENTKLDLKTAYEQARTLALAQKHADSFSSSSSFAAAIAEPELSSPPSDLPQVAVASASNATGKCFFCGHSRHPRSRCPAKDVICHSCGKKGHFSKVCRSGRPPTSAAAPNLAAISAAAPGSLSKSIVNVTVEGVKAKALIDTGSSESFVNACFASDHGLKQSPGHGSVTMASSLMSSEILGIVRADVSLSGRSYEDIKLSVIQDLCCDVILGHDFLNLHSGLQIQFEGDKPKLSVCGLAAAAISPPSLFDNLTEDCKPIATKSRKYSDSEQSFISAEVERMLKEGIIEPSKSPWRSQVLVTSDENHKRRMVVDYSATINRYTALDAYPLPNIEEMVRKIANYRVYSTLDLLSAYHQVPIKKEDRPYTAFEADHQLFQFCRVPFGITNGVSCFQRIIDDIVRNEKLNGTFAYIDDVTVCGRDQEEHDINLKKVLDAFSKYGLTLNKNKYVYSVNSLKLLGYVVQDGTMKPDPERLKSLIQLPAPTNTAALKRVLGMFSHYAHWVPRFSEKVKALNSTQSFPLAQSALDAFEQMKNDILASSIKAVDPTTTLVVETDASDFATAATLSQEGKPVAFFSRTLNACEMRHSSIEKEAYAIVESLKAWRHWLIGKQFRLITDQQSVSFMFSTKHKSKIKNDKIARWRMELSPYKYDIVYRPGRENTVADTLSRVCSSVTTDELTRTHNFLCHPGMVRLYHFVRSRNMPYSIDDVKKVVNSCRTCAELKPRYARSNTGPLIKATHPLERLNMDFKGPVPSSSKNRYLLTIVDEFSRFPFAFPCPDMTASTVIRCLSQLFAIFGMPSYIHTDRGSTFMSEELKKFLHGRGIATSRTSPYNPEGNGLIERYNGIIWKSVTLALKSLNLPITEWETVLPDALHSIRSLLSTLTNCTPHERMFCHLRKTTSRASIPSWLVSPDQKVLYKRQVRQSKYDPLVDEVTLLEANPSYAHIRFPDGRESTVSLRHLAPAGEHRTQDDDAVTNEHSDVTSPKPVEPPEALPTYNEDGTRMAPDQNVHHHSNDSSPLYTKLNPRRSGRDRRPPAHLQDFVTNNVADSGKRLSCVLPGSHRSLRF